MKLTKVSEIKSKARRKGSSYAFQGKYFRWVVPQAPISTRFELVTASVQEMIQQFKKQVLDALLRSKTAKKGLEYYSIAVQTHLDGHYHLDLLLTFTKRVALGLNELDFLLGKHGNLTKYRSLNASILSYNFKTDDAPISNLPPVTTILELQKLKTDPYGYLQTQMLKDPYGFNLASFCASNSYFRHLRGFSSLASKLRIHQEAVCNLRLAERPGFPYITDDLIRSLLSPDQVRLYYSWPGYASIVQFLNHVPTYGTRRPTHTPNLFIHGRPRIGKTSLIQTIQTCTSVYPVGTQNWFPKFSNHVYKLMFWDQCRLGMMAWQQVLILLDGRPYDLPFKGGSTLKCDNQLWILTSNKSVKTHLKQKHSWLQQNFDDPFQQNVIQTSFRKRVVQVSVPPELDLFVLVKLLRLLIT